MVSAEEKKEIDKAWKEARPGTHRLDDDLKIIPKEEEEPDDLTFSEAMRLFDREHYLKKEDKKEIKGDK